MFLIIGHRGAAGVEPENTLPSFESAWRSGVDAIELDVQRVEDELVVIHDDTLERTTNGIGPVAAQSLADLQALDAGNGYGVPTLSKVLAAAPPNALINIELKGKRTAELAAAATLAHPDLRFIASSFSHDELRDFVNVPHRADIAPLFHYWRNVPSRAESFAPRFVNISARIATESRVARLRERGWRVLVYTVNDRATGEALKRFGVSGVFTDYPDRLMPLRESENPA